MALVIGCLGLVIALVAGFPFFAKILIYLTHKHAIDVFFPPPDEDKRVLRFHEIKSDECEYKPLNFLNKNTQVGFYISYEFLASKPIKLDMRAEKKYSEYLGPGGFAFKLAREEHYISRRGVLAISFPFEPYNEDYTLQVIVYPSVELVEFKLPRFLGRVDLKPMKKDYVIKTQ